MKIRRGRKGNRGRGRRERRGEGEGGKGEGKLGSIIKYSMITN